MMMSYIMVNTPMAVYRTVVSSKGQVVIPAELREQLGLQKGTPATWSEEQGRLVLTPITEQRLDEIMGLGYADAFAAELAIEQGAWRVTADPELAQVGKRLPVYSLPRPEK
jgi:AbrB family looped-hinge helix DNA binding protein